MAAPPVRSEVVAAAPACTAGVLRLGCVSFLNSKPLVHGLEASADLHLRLAVPSRLLADLERGDVDLALCPVIDYQTSGVPLVIVPVGGIACHGPTFTVRLFSCVPIDRLDTIAVDGDSHTSVMLLRVLMWELHQRRPTLVPLRDGDREAQPDGDHDAPAMLLIGDKVVTARPDAGRYPHEMDLGQAWRELTGMPFVFAVWMARQGTPLGELPRRLETLLAANLSRLDEIVHRYAPPAGWPADLARQYLGRWLQYPITPAHLEAIERFFDLVRAQDLIAQTRPLRLYP